MIYLPILKIYTKGFSRNQPTYLLPKAPSNMTSTTTTSSMPVVTTTATPKYASKEHIAKVFSHCLAGDWDGFFAWVVPDVRE